MQKRTRFLSTAFCTILSCFNEFLFSRNLHFRILTRPCFSCLSVPLASNPDLLSFCTQYANDFANPANSVLIPVFLFFNKQWRGGGGGWGIQLLNVESFNVESLNAESFIVESLNAESFNVESFNSENHATANHTTSKIFKSRIF